MGWVEDRFKTEDMYEKGLAVLWDEMRDSIGAGIIAVNTRADEIVVEHKDCTARSRFCVRIVRRSDPSKSIEVFLDPPSRMLRTSGPMSIDSTVDVFPYRVSSNLERLEYFKKGDKEDAVATEQACQKAIEAFLFGESPKPTVGPR